MFQQRSTLQGSLTLAAARGEDARFDNEHILRYAIGVAVGLAATLLLFLPMRALIKSDRKPFSERERGQILEFVQLEEQEEPNNTTIISCWPPGAWPELDFLTEIPETAEIETWILARAAADDSTADEMQAMWPEFPVVCPPSLLKPGERARGQAAENAVSVLETGCIAFKSLARG